jgi:hypothetical protein
MKTQSRLAAGTSRHRRAHRGCCASKRKCLSDRTRLPRIAGFGSEGLVRLPSGFRVSPFASVHGFSRATHQCEARPHGQCQYDVQFASVEQPVHLTHKDAATVLAITPTVSVIPSFVALLRQSQSQNPPSPTQTSLCLAQAVRRPHQYPVTGYSAHRPPRYGFRNATGHCLS